MGTSPPLPAPQEGKGMLLSHAATSFNLLFLFAYFSSILLIKFLLSLFTKAQTSTGSNDFQGGLKERGAEFENCSEREDLIADIVHGGDDLLFLNSKITYEDPLLVVEENQYEEHQETGFLEQISDEEKDDDHDELTEDDLDMEAADQPSALPREPPYFEILLGGEAAAKGGLELPKEEKSFSKDDDFSVSEQYKSDNAKLCAKEEESEEILAGSFTGGSTSNSSRDWRSSTNFRDSETDDPFSSSSRRSASHWETYTVYKKYDEEMMFLDRISAQKLTETESLRSVEVNPRSISQRIVHKLASRSSHSRELGRSPCEELEAAYVAQLCLAWEALSWNYKNLCRVKARGDGEGPACPAQIAQHFQQFQVLLQRFIETEPFEQGSRPEIYARMRISRPKLLHVPEFQGSEGDRGKEGIEPRISSTEFLVIMEDCIRTFMNFVRADKESYCRKLGAFFRRSQGSVDPTLLNLVKKANKRKKRKLKDVRRSRRCFRKKRLKEEEGMEILMSMIDLKVVSRVLRMSEMNEEQLHWCEEKISRVRVWDGKLQRDSSPLFFPAH